MLRSERLLWLKLLCLTARNYIKFSTYPQLPMLLQWLCCGRDRASLIIRKERDHRVSEVWLRKL